MPHAQNSSAKPELAVDKRGWRPYLKGDDHANGRYEIEKNNK